MRHPLARLLVWVLVAPLLIIGGTELRPWLDGEPFEATPPPALLQKINRAVLEVSLAFVQDAPLAKGRECLRAFNYPCAEILFQRHLERVPNDGRALGLLATAQFRQDKFPQTVATAEKAIAQGEATPDLFRFYGESLEQVGRASESLKWYYRALAVAPASLEVRRALVQQLMVEGRADEAMALAIAYDTALANRRRGPAFAAQRILLEDMLAKSTGTRRAAKNELKLVRLDNHFHVPVKVGQLNYASFMLDTGATMTVMPRDMFETSKAAASLVDRNVQTKLADGRTIKGSRFRLAELRVGQTLLKGVELFVCDSCVLLLGQTTLQHFDMRQQKVEGVEYMILTER
jgi:predicted aspartyl protease